MKVLHVIPSVAERYGGPSQAVLQMCRALRTRGVDAAIATTDADGPGRLPVPIGRFDPFANVPTVFFHRQFSESLKYSWPLGRWLDAHVRDYDVVHIHAVFSHACMVAARVCRRRGVPYVVRPLGTLTPWSMAQKRARKQAFWRFGAARMLRQASAVHYTTPEESTATAASLGLDRGVVIGLGVDDGLLSGYAPGPQPAGAPYILVMSRLHPVKRLELALEALFHVLGTDRFAAWRVVLAGDGDPDYVTSLRRLVEESGLADRVRFAGWLRGSEKADALRNASLFLLPSLHESFGLAIVEAMACGLPVVISREIALGRTVESAGAGWVVAPEFDVLVAALTDALGSPVERRQRGAAGCALVRARFTWPAIAAELEALYERLIADHGSLAAPARGGSERPADALT